MTPQTAKPPFQILLLGCGQIGQLHAARLAADPRARIVALVDPNREAAAALAATYAPEAIVATDVEAALGSGSVDGAVICTPTGQHFSQVREFRSRGIAVSCEKPLADSRERIVDLIADAQHGPLLTIAYQRRYSSVFRTARREIQSGRFGRVRSVVVYNCERWAQTISGTWRNDPRQNPGGYLGDAGSHKVDMVFFVTGLPPREVHAQSQKRSWNVDVVTQITAVIGDDVPLTMAFIGDAHHYYEEFRIHCELGDLIVRENTLEFAQENRRESILDLERESNPDEAFLDYLSGTAENTAPADIALPVWDFTTAALESANTRKIVCLSGR
ncbi:MAG: Gfo/Idh/MocA family oxidoreductase [Planctomycetota bacterium]|nr:Gfo/Idh/MocA family oxidoreductase [Planctomycetota bacterium]